ncbi:manganese-dependent ADP-ribose/CDP-alcohol diphosphatase-like [Physella acuta]|uniref:manganese-dependent ADP-ribose/CDP-alcohol diphosphatase-like n=1 Tax=Physella acuta TaxID=109671 RepID=UPI0027DE0C41|nr:manganese-dependent ADP-ribose/CDP-alcohol diphosphatase-like [Physella acuta]
MALSTNKDKSQLTFGIIADIQYADHNDGPDFSNTKTRYYRSSLKLARNAIEKWKSMEDPVAFVIQLGDLIDRHSTFQNNGSDEAFLMVMEILNNLKAPIFHVIVAVDAYELSVLGYDDKSNDDNFRTGQQLLQQNNPNKDWNDTSGLEGLNKRWAAYNGGVSEKQLEWMSETLQAAQENEENVIIITHVPLLSKDGICLTWNYEEILHTISKYNCVVGVFSGHDHSGWDVVDENGIQHITFQGVIETSPDGNAFATAHLMDESLVIDGVGRVPSFVIPLRYCIKTTVESTQLWNTTSLLH